MELTINNIIKITIGIVVFTVVVLGVYFAVNEYISPYFSGFSFNNTRYVNVEGSEDICSKKTVLGRIDLHDFSMFKTEKNYLFLGAEPTLIFVDSGGKALMWDGKIKNYEIGRINGVQIEIFVNLDSDFNSAKAFDGAYIGGNEICK